MTRVNLGTESSLTDHLGANRRVGLLSDGYVVCAYVHDGYLRLQVGTPDRGSFTQAVAIAFSAARYLTIEVDDDDSVHVSWNNSSGDMRYMKFTRTDTTEYTAGTPLTVEEFGTNFLMGRRDIAVTPAGSVVIMCLTYIFGPGHHVAARIYFKKFGTSTWSEIYVSPTETETDADLWGACSIAIDRTAPVSNECHFVIAYQLVFGKSTYIKSLKINEVTGADTGLTAITTIAPVTSGSHNARVTSAQVFSVDEQRWVVVGAIGHAKAASFTRPFVVTCSRTAVLKRTDGVGGTDGTDTYDTSKEGAYPSFAVIQNISGYRCAVVLTANTNSATLAKRGVNTRTIPLDSSWLPSGNWGPGTQLIVGGYSFISAGAQPRYESNFLDGMIVRRDTRTHYYMRNATPVAPTGVTPGNGSTVTTGKPRLAATLATLAGGVATGRVLAQWLLATNSGFTTGLESPVEPITAFGAAGVRQFTITDPITSGLWYYKARAISEFGTVGAWSVATTFTVGHPPTLSQLQPTGYAKNGSIEFKGMFSDPYPSDVQTAIRVQVFTDGGAETVWDSGKVAGTSVSYPAWTDVLNEPLQWRAKAWDIDDTEGEWSDFVTLTVDNGPTIELLAYETHTPLPVFEWSYSGNRPQKRWAIVLRRLSDGLVLHTAGGVGTMTEYAMTDQTLIKNNVPIYIELTVWDTGDIWSMVWDTETFLWTPPPAPAMFVLPETFEEDGHVTITWNDEAREDDAFVAWRIYRRVQGTTKHFLLHEQYNADGADEEGNYYFVDRFAPSNLASEWIVVQVVLRFEAEIESTFVPVADIAQGTHYWLVHPLYEELDLLLYNVTSDTFTDRTERAELVLAGRGAKVEIGTHIGRAGTLVAKIWTWESGDTPAVRRMKLEAMQRDGSWVWLRTPFGDMWRVTPGDIAYTRVAGTGIDEVLEVTIPYTEVQ